MDFKVENNTITVEVEAGELERLRLLTFCDCGDQFSAHDPGTCGACVAAKDCGAHFDRLELGRLRKYAGRWEAYRKAGGELTGRLHNLRGDFRDACIDAYMEAPQGERP
jgi:hypothetical protein